MQPTAQRFSSNNQCRSNFQRLLIAMSYVIAMIVHAGSVTVDVIKLIWFPDELGSMFFVKIQA